MVVFVYDLVTGDVTQRVIHPARATVTDAPRYQRKLYRRRRRRRCSAVPCASQGSSLQRNVDGRPKFIAKQHPQNRIYLYSSERTECYDFFERPHSSYASAFSTA